MNQRPQITPLSQVLSDTDAALNAIASAAEPTLAELLQELVNLNKKQREETDNAIKEIAHKINRINSSIK